MLFLYRIALQYYRFMAWVFSRFNTKAKYWIDGQQGLIRNIEGKVPRDKNVIWIHAASVGEFEQGRPIIEAIRKQEIDYFILLTFFSPSGYLLRKNYQLVDLVSYLPLDSPGNARQFIDIVNPKLAIFIKYDFWYYYLWTLGQKNIPTLYISCILRENHFLTRPYGRFFIPVLQNVAHYFVQDENSGALLKNIGIGQYTVAGDTRFDRVLEISKNADDIPLISNFINGEQVVVFGSAWASDLEVIKSFMLKIKDQRKILIAPHNIEEKLLKPFLELPHSIRYSGLGKNSDHEYRILVIDNIGMLSRLYKYGHFAIVGGAFNGTLHNVLEPAVYGIPVFFGNHKNNQKFLEAKGLIDAGGGFSFTDSHELQDLFNNLDKNEEAYNKAATAAGNFVKSGAGATSMIMKKINEVL